MADSKGTQYSPFSANWSSTDALLDRELRALGARNVVLMVNVSEADIRLDGRLRANAHPDSPHAALAFDARKQGALLVCCGRFRSWQDNVRGIALGMEALRKIERYGIVQANEQYAGWKAIGSGGDAPMDPNEVVAASWTLIAHHAGWTVERAQSDSRTAYRMAIKATHPDQGGEPAAFHAVQNAARILGIV